MYENGTMTGFINKSFFLSEPHTQILMHEILCMGFASKQFGRQRCKGSLIKCKCGCELTSVGAE